MFESLKATLSKETCPFCFERFGLRDAPFRCGNKRCAQVRDEVLSKAWGDNRPIGNVIPPRRALSRESACPDCGELARKRLCPACHMELPHTVGESRSFVFAVIGAKEAGKSHYLAVLIHQIQNVLGPGLDMLLEPLNEYTIKRYREGFYDPVYNQHKTIDVTRSGIADRTVQIPMIYSLTFMGKGLTGKSKIVAAVTLVFFDTAGEDLKDQDVMATVNKYIYCADGIILLLDPLQLPWVRDQLSGRTALPVSTTETSDIVTRTSNLILAGRHLKADARIQTPLAVAFSKIDAVSTLVDAQMQMNASPRHAGGFDLADQGAVNDEMQALLARWNGTYLVQQVSTRYEKFSFFGLTALGCNPHADGKIPRVIPHRVEDPFLWLLYRQGLIKGSRP